MSLALTSGTLALCPGNATQFLGIGGSSPYHYVVLPGGAGGVIDPDTGDYTAPATLNENPARTSDTIQVRDSAGATATASIMTGSALMLLCNIIQVEMGLDEGQVYLYDQKRNIPTDSKLYVSVGVLTCKPFSNNLVPDGASAGMNAIQSTSFGATLSLDIFSRGVQARDRKEEVIMSLNSIYSQSQQETNGFYVGKISSAFVNLSQIDGAAIPYRFNISVNVIYSVRKVKSVPYFSDFRAASITVEP